MQKDAEKGDTPDSTPEEKQKHPIVTTTPISETKS